MPVSKDDVVAAYRLILGREPTDREASEWLHLESVAELRGAFLASGEFRDGLPKVVPAFASAAARLPLDCQPISVEWTTSTGSEKKLVQYVTATWTALGKVEPHWSVLSSPDFKSDRIGETAEVFFESGREDAARIAATLARHGLAPEKFPRMVEYGCGVGRVTPFLAGMFGEVAAIDISESHLDLARQVVARKGCRNVTLTLARAPEFGMRAAFDLWFSHIVLQHNPPPVMALVLQRMFQMLAPGGVAIFQVPTHVPGYRFNVAEYLAAPKDGSIEVHCLPQEAVFQIADAAGCVPLEVREDDAMPPPWLSDVFVFRKKPF